MRLTDQASVAVRMARAFPEPTVPRASANVAHLVAGLMGEPEGMAGTVLRQRFGEVAPRIALHPAVTSASLPSLATAFVALPVRSRPAWTLEVLGAARRVGGEDLDYLLTDCGVSLAGIEDDLTPWMPGPQEIEEHPIAAETFGRFSLVPHRFSDAADLALARVRAQGGDSSALLGWLGADDATSDALASAPAVPLDAVLERAAAPGSPADVADLVTVVTHLSLRAALRG